MSFDALFPWMPVFNTLHAIGLTILLGSVVILSLRLLGIAMRIRPVTIVAAPLNRAITVGITVMILTGLMLFLPEIDRWVGNGPFRVKMMCLAAALAFHFAVVRRVTRHDGVSPLAMRLTGAMSLLLWYAVGMGGRALTFLGE